MGYAILVIFMLVGIALLITKGEKAQSKVKDPRLAELESAFQDTLSTMGGQ